MNLKQILCMLLAVAIFGSGRMNSSYASQIIKLQVKLESGLGCMRRERLETFQVGSGEKIKMKADFFNQTMIIQPIDLGNGEIKISTLTNASDNEFFMMEGDQEEIVVRDGTADKFLIAKIKLR